MTDTDPSLEACLALVHGLEPGTGRRLIAIAGPPGSGKSTIAARLSARLQADGDLAVVVPMDGFHLDNAILDIRGLRSRKGAPETFDLAGFVALVNRLKQPGEVLVPLFDRARDIAVAGAGVVPDQCRYVIVEGNYLLFDEPGWRDLAKLWDCSLFIAAPWDDLRSRLVRRWRDQGMEPDAAVARAEGNDLANARRILAAQLPADLRL